MRSITKFDKSSFSRVMGANKPDGCGQEVEDSSGESKWDLAFKVKTCVFSCKNFERTSRDKTIIVGKQR